MPTIFQSLAIQAPIERVFDLARSVDLHMASTQSSGEVAVGGVKSGLMEEGDEVTWEARHLGVRQRLTSRLVELDYPNRFRDVMTHGVFKRLDHVHHFEPNGSFTVMSDEFVFEAPLGILGSLAERLFLTKYLGKFLRQRNEHIKRVAESESAWRQYL